MLGKSEGVLLWCQGDAFLNESTEAKWRKRAAIVRGANDILLIEYLHHKLSKANWIKIWFYGDFTPFVYSHVLVFTSLLNDREYFTLFHT